jgi:poly(A) polymerase
MDARIELEQANLIPKSQHGILPCWIDKKVLYVVNELRQAGFQAYLVGGCVRDLLAGLCPKDFDVVTNAVPGQIKAIFKRCCRIIGRRFRIAHVFFDRKIIEVVTFRGADHNERCCSNALGMMVRDNAYGTIDEDAYRRDFTINSLYYDPVNESILDFTGGFGDLKQRKLRVIGQATERYREDPVRMLRALRFMAKLDLSPTSDTDTAVHVQKALLGNISAARLYDEVKKLFLYGHAENAFLQLEGYGVFELLFPQTAMQFDKEVLFRPFLMNLFRMTDERVNLSKPVIPSFLFAALLWLPFKVALRSSQTNKLFEKSVRKQQAKMVLNQQALRTTLPIRTKIDIWQIWSLQFSLETCKSGLVKRISKHPRFKAAYDFLLLRASIFDGLDPVVAWWEEQLFLASPVEKSKLRSR